jgi:hypothetical protein
MTTYRLQIATIVSGAGRAGKSAYIYTPVHDRQVDRPFAPLQLCIFAYEPLRVRPSHDVYSDIFTDVDILYNIRFPDGY